ncbi:MAG: DUF3108 domain-containing protein [Candidatus Binatia bacterium]|nr:DUF3108 domain-containing protein [Candidatus Binatia bacterium]MDG1957407.1 DUF3108 domain-containing protein [Candidatus Binatia bacterium]MDG2008892.1 DUF3108 domain-containing protein [Candidatus Binatia bacterium]
MSSRLGGISKSLGLVLLTGLLATGTPEAAENPARAPKVVLEYELHWRFLHILTFTSTSRLDTAGTYRMETEAETVGVIDTFFPWKARSEAWGQVRGARLRPEEYHSRSHFRGEVQEVDVAYEANGPKVAIRGEILSDGDRAPVPTIQQRGTLDPLTAVAELSRSLTEGGRCQGRWPVFDGLRRYDLLYEDLGPTTIPPSDNDPWVGEGRLCRVRFDLKGGQWRGEDRPEEDPSRVFVWLQTHSPELGPIPVRFRVEAERGALDVHLAKAPTVVREGVEATP